ncbi:MAG: hypothetical protein AAF512_05000 [Pseudomonadota bacterium]
MNAVIEVNDLLEASDEEAALEMLHEMGCTDGLPVVIPTQARVDRFVLASGMDADMVLGEMGPAMGIATVEKVAIAAVMAGCKPDYMPIVVAAAKAVADPRFDLGPLQATTHCTAPLLIVNGPARIDCGPVASGFGALGPGHRANASIGRALRLCLINIGGGKPGVSDMALLGHPGKFTYCLAEAEEDSPFPPMHTSLGFEASDSVVTVLGCEAPHSVLYSDNADDPEDAEKLLHVLSIGLANLATNNAIFCSGSVMVVLGPKHADVLARANMRREDIQQRLWELTHLSTADHNRYGQQFGSRFSGETYNAFKEPANILVMVAGGSGLYSMVMPNWGGADHGNCPVSVKVETDLFCEVPGLAGT